MTRGWFTGLLLGKIDRTKLCVAHDGGIASFPTPLLREAGVPRDLLPAILESLGLAYGEVAKLYALSPLHAYVALRDLGTQPGLTSLEAAHLYDQLNPSLDRWVRTGDLGHTLVDGLAPLAAGGKGDSAEERRNAALSVITENLDDYRVDIDRYVGAGSSETPAPWAAAYGMWPGMWSIIEQALKELAGTALHTMSLVDVSRKM